MMLFASVFQGVPTAVPAWLVVVGISVTVAVGVTTVLNILIARVWQRGWDASKVVLSIDNLTTVVRELREDFKQVIAIDKRVAVIEQRVGAMEDKMP